MLYRALCKQRDAAALVKELKAEIASNAEMTDPYNALMGALEALEGMVAEGWVVAGVTPNRPFLKVTLDESSVSFANA